MKYVVYITEELQRGIVVEADSQESAQEKVQKAYDEEKIVLDYSDYNGYDVKCDREASGWDIGHYPKLEDI